MSDEASESETSPSQGFEFKVHPAITASVCHPKVAGLPRYLRICIFRITAESILLWFRQFIPSLWWQNITQVILWEKTCRYGIAIHVIPTIMITGGKATWWKQLSTRYKIWQDMCWNKRRVKMIFTLIKTHDGINPSPSTQVISPWTSCFTIQIPFITTSVQISRHLVVVGTYIKIQGWIIFWWLENNIGLALQKTGQIMPFPLNIC